MAHDAPLPDPERREGERWLCSHIVRLVFEDHRYAAQTVLLEDIGSEGAGLGVETAYPKGLRLKIRAKGFAAPASVIECRARETDYRLSVRFEEGYQWNRSIWEPDHLFLPPREHTKKRGAAQGGDKR